MKVMRYVAPYYHRYHSYISSLLLSFYHHF